MTSAQQPGVFCSRRLERVFEHCFTAELNTRLVGGAAEPLYQPCGQGHEESVLFYREDYFASALHEVAHWCIAGRERRTRVDFGYWYAPDGRTVAQQRAFEKVEYKPQALEWFFSKACDRPFRLSVDNLDAPDGSALDTTDFGQLVLAQALYWQVGGLPERALVFFRALCAEFGTGLTPAALFFFESELQ